MPPCPSCQQPATKRNGFDGRGRPKYACRACRRTFTETTVSAVSGYRWPADVILTAVRWYLAYPLASQHILELLAERDIDVSHRTILNWAKAFGPGLADEVRRRRRPVGRRWFVDEVFLVPQGTETVPLSSHRRGRRGRRCPAPRAPRHRQCRGLLSAGGRADWHSSER